MAAALVVLLPSTVATAATTEATGRINDVTNDVGSVRFLYSSSGLPDGTGLDPDSVTVEFVPSEGEPVTLSATAETLGGQSEQVRQTAVLAVDRSGSLGEVNMAAVRAAANAFLDAVPPEVQVGLVTFGDPATVDVLPTTDRAQVRARIDALVDEGGTALFDATVEATRLLPGEGVQRVVVLTDGADANNNNTGPGSEASQDVAVAAVQASGATITAVAFGEAASQQALQALATAGQGQVVDASGADDLAGAFAAVAQSIATDLIVTAEVPEELSGRRGNIVVTARAGDQTLSTAAFTTLASIPVALEPSAEPSDVAAAPSPLLDAPALDARFGSPLLYAGLGGLFLALLAMAVVLVGLVSRGKTPQALRQRSLAVYAIRGGRGPRLLKQESAQATKLGNNAVARSAVELAGRVVESRNSTEKLAAKLDAANVPLRPAEWAVLRVAVPAALGILLLLLSQGNVLALLLGVVLGVLAPVMYLSIRTSRRKKAFMSILPDTLALMASGLRAGYSLPQAMDSVVREGREPIRSEFNRALIEARLGVPAEDALEGIAERMDSQDFKWVVMAIRIQREVGGNLAELLDTVSGTIRERDRLRRLVSTLSAEGRLSAWILGLLPVVFATYLLLTQPQYLQPLITNPLGILLLVASLVVFGIGVLGLRWAVSVDV